MNSGDLTEAAELGGESGREREGGRWSKAEAVAAELDSESPGVARETVMG